MSEDKLKQELLYMVGLASKYDLKNKDVVTSILKLEEQRTILDSVFGQRFKKRIIDISNNECKDDSCVICGNKAYNQVICKSCIDKIGGSAYAKNKTESIDKAESVEETEVKTEPEVEALKATSVVKNRDILGFAKTFLSRVILVCLILLFAFQVWIIGLYLTIPDRNVITEPKVSSYEATAVTSVDEAYQALLLDFPEEEGYTISFAREDLEYVGRFLLNKGDSINEVEEALTDEERYDYFFQEKVFVFHISYLVDGSGKLGVAEVNESGHIIVMGQFNDGRSTDSYYFYR